MRSRSSSAAPNWTTSDLLNADFSNAGVAALDGFVIDNAAPAGAVDQVAGLWHLTSRRGGEAGHTGPHSLWYGDETLGNYAVGRSAGRVTSPTVNLTAVSGAELSFNYILNVEEDRRTTSSIRPGCWFPRTAARPSHRCWRSPPRSPTRSPAGPPRRVNLSDFVGSQIQIRFDFDTVDAQGQHHGRLADRRRGRAPVLLGGQSEREAHRGRGADPRVAGLGDFSGDGIADFGVLQKSATNQVTVSIVEGSASGAPAANGTLSAAADTVFVFNTDDANARGLQLAGGGDLDNDGAAELLITSTTLSKLVFGGDVTAANPVNLDTFASANPGRVLQLEGSSLVGARRCQRRRLRRSGNDRAHQDPAPGGDRPDRADGLQLPAGRARCSWAARALPSISTVPDLVFEAAKPDYVLSILSTAFGASRINLFSGIGDVDGDDVVDFVLADAIGGGVSVFLGQALQNAQRRRERHASSNPSCSSSIWPLRCCPVCRPPPG